MDSQTYIVTLKAYGMCKTVYIEARSANEAKREAERSTSIGTAVSVKLLAPPAVR